MLKDEGSQNKKKSYIISRVQTRRNGDITKSTKSIETPIKRMKHKPRPWGRGQHLWMNQTHKICIPTLAGEITNYRPGENVRTDAAATFFFYEAPRNPHHRHLPLWSHTYDMSLIQSSPSTRLWQCLLISGSADVRHARRRVWVLSMGTDKVGWLLSEAGELYISDVSAALLLSTSLTGCRQGYFTDCGPTHTYLAWGAGRILQYGMVLFVIATWCVSFMSTHLGKPYSIEGGYRSKSSTYGLVGSSAAVWSSVRSVCSQCFLRDCDSQSSAVECHARISLLRTCVIDRIDWRSRIFKSRGPHLWLSIVSKL